MSRSEYPEHPENRQPATRHTRVCVIIAGGDVEECMQIPAAALVICADCGYRHAQAQQIVPDVLVGDFDSYIGTLPEQIPVVQLPVEKDVSDTAYAVEYAQAQGCREFILYGMCGGERVDHMIANLQLLHAMAERELDVTCYYRNQVLQTVRHTRFVIPCQTYQDFSVFALSAICKGVTISGAKYTLQDSELRNTVPLGLSNTCLPGISPVISVEEGILLLVLTEKEK